MNRSYQRLYKKCLENGQLRKQINQLETKLNKMNPSTNEQVANDKAYEVAQKNVSDAMKRGEMHDNRTSPKSNRLPKEYAYIEMKEIAIAYKMWLSTLTAAKKCTVHPPSGSGGSTGIYNRTDSDLFEEFFKQLNPTTNEQ
jgi:ribosomal protein S20